jgi:hypothetical protein
MPQLILWPPPWKRSFPGAGLLTLAYIILVVVPLTVVVTLAIFLIVKPYEFFFARHSGPRMNAWQVANVIERAASARVDDDEWDDFSCVPMRDARLDAAVSRAVQIVEVERPAGRLTQEDAERELKMLARELRGWDV